MVFLLDTNAISELMYDHPTVVARLTAASASHAILTSTIVRGEILFGVTRLPMGKRKALLQAKAIAAFTILRCEPITAVVADRYAHIKTAQQKRGLPLDENDLWIAATALTLDATIVSRDTDLARIEGLRVIDWTL